MCVLLPQRYQNYSCHHVVCGVNCNLLKYFFFCDFVLTLYLFHSADALEGAAARDPPGQSSPMGDRKKNRRKKSMNQKGDTAVGQAEGSSRAKDLLRDFLSSPPSALQLVFSPSLFFLFSFSFSLFFFPLLHGSQTQNVEVKEFW